MNTSLTSPPFPRGQPARLERAAVLHVAILLIFVTWALGGNVSWARSIMTYAGLSGLILTLLEFTLKIRGNYNITRPLLWLTPLLVFNGLVLLSLLHPSLRNITVEGTNVLIPQKVPDGLPSTARPDLTLPALWLFDALFIPAFNLALICRTRASLRFLFVLMVLNAAVLAVFGTLQKLVHSSGIYFGAVHSPNETFFASFIYHNHWGSFVLLATAVAAGLMFQRDRNKTHRNFFHSPRFSLAVIILCLAATIPLSSSRSCTVLICGLIGVCLIQGVRRISRQTERSPVDRQLKLGLIAATAISAAIACYVLAAPVMGKRVTQTRDQISEMARTHSIGGRAELYGDTFSMARDRPVFGWGLASYATVFARFNKQTSVDNLPQYYEDAHSDWLQALAETGLLGLLCRIALVLLPLMGIRKLSPFSSLTLYPLLGCAIVVLYATIEFPFGNVAVTYLTWVCFFAAIRMAQVVARERRR